METAAFILRLLADVSIIFLFVALVVLVLKLSKTFNALTQKLDDLSHDVKDIKPKLETSLEKVNALSDNLGTLFSNVNEQVDKVGIVVNKFTDTANDVLDLTSNLQQKLQTPLLESAGKIAAVSSGVRAFMNAWNSGKGSRIAKKQLKMTEELSDSVDDFNRELEEVNSQLAELKSKITDE